MSTYLIGDGEKEISTLTGDVTLAKPIIDLHARKTVRIEGVGEALTGLYYVTESELKVSKEGVRQSLKVERNGFSDYITAYDVAIKNTGNKQSNNITPVNKNIVHICSEGDTLWGIALRYYGKSEEYTKIYNANKEVINNINHLTVGTPLLIP